jgi:hypothetical protein
VAILRELAEIYGAHPAFFGWYFASEAFIGPYFSSDFLRYAAAMTAAARNVTPAAFMFISPYGTRQATNDSTFVAQLRALAASGISAIAYQDEVGCIRDEFPLQTVTASWATLAAAHRAAGGMPHIWANIESFTWEGLPNNVSSPLIPAPWPRVLAQLAAAAPHVDRAITFSAQALLDPAGSAQPWGAPDATRAYDEWQAVFPGANTGVGPTLAGRLLADVVGGRRVSHAAVGARVDRLTPAPIAGAAPDVLTDGRCGAPWPFGEGAAAGEWMGWRGLGAQPPTVNIVLALAEAVPVANASVHVLCVSRQWFVDGNGAKAVARNLSAALPLNVSFFGANASLAPGSEAWQLLGSSASRPWGQERYDVRTEVLTAEGSALPFSWIWVQVHPAPSVRVEDTLLVSEVMVNAVPSSL